MTLRYPHARWHPFPGRAGAPFASTVPYRIVHHSTEGYDAASAFTRLRRYAPHFTIDHDGVVFQHVDINHSCYALQSIVNRDHAIQIEHVMFAAKHPKSDAVLRSSQALCAWLMQVLKIRCDWPAGLPITTPTPRTPFRVSLDFWRAHGGHYGHCHVPKQSHGHWDPGMNAAEVAIVTPHYTVKGQALAA